MSDGAPRKRGRPPGRKVGETIGLRLPIEIEQRLDAWIASQGTDFTRPDAIRRLLHRALPKPPRPPHPPGLQARARKNGIAYYWISTALARDTKGFTPVTVRLHGKTEKARGERCEELTRELRGWLAGQGR